MTKKDLHSRFVSRSYVAALDKPEQEAVMQKLDALLQQNASLFRPGAAGSDEVIDVVLKTELFVCKRTG